MIEWTGERYLPWIESGHIHYEHLHRYAYARQFVKDKKVIDLACGEGYGAALLAEDATHVLGIDIDEPTIAHAASRYTKDNLEFIIGSIIDIPVKGRGKFDVAVCFEAIEHIAEHEQLLSEVKRILKHDGLLIISTPNKALYTDIPNSHNPFHLKELYFDQFEALLLQYFENVRVLGQRVYSGSDIWDIAPHKPCSVMEVVVKKADNELQFTGIEDKEPVYLIALASNSDLANTRFSDYSRLTDLSDTLYQSQATRWNYEIQTRDAQLIELNTALQTRDAQLVELNTALQTRDAQLIELNTALQTRDAQLAELNAALQTRDAQLAELNTALQTRDAQINDLINQAYMVSLDPALQAKDAQLAALNTALQTRDAQLADIQAQMHQINQGIIVQVMSRFRNIIDKLLRPGTKPRNFYELGLTGMRVILNEGWRSFFRQARVRFTRSATSPQKTALTLPKFDDSISKQEAEKLIFPVPPDEPEVSIIIPAYNNCQYTLNCLKSISENTVGDFEVIVVDDCSSDGTKDILSKIGNLRLIRNKHNSGFVYSCNHGAKASKGKFILFLNNDTMVTWNWLQPMLDLIKREDVGVVGSRLVYPDGKLQEAGGIIWSNGNGWNYGRNDQPDKPEYNYVREVDYCSGASLMIKKELFNKIGGLDIQFKPGYYEDVDLCFTVKNMGYRVLYQPMSVVIHFEGITGGTDITTGTKKYQEINRDKFLIKWKDVLNSDHYEYDTDKLFYARTRKKGNNILVLDQCVPRYDRDAGSLRMLYILRILSELDYNITLISDDLKNTPPYTAVLQTQGIEIIYRPYTQSVANYITANTKYFDIFWLSRPLSVKYIDIIKRINPKAMVIYDTVDLHFLRLKRQAEINNDFKVMKLSNDMQEKELYLMTNTNKTVVVSEYEKQLLNSTYPSIDVNIVSLIHDIHPPIRTFNERKDLLLVAGFDHLPNIDAANYFIKDIFPLVKKDLPGLKVYLVGNIPSPHPAEQVLELKAEDVIVTGYVKDLTDYFENCRVFIAPLRFGAGVKGKITQSMSYGLPVVTTDIGAESMYMVDGENGLIANDEQSFAAKIVSLYNDELFWNKISLNSVKNIEDHFSYNIAKDQIRKLIEWRPSRQIKAD